LKQGLFEERISWRGRGDGRGEKINLPARRNVNRTEGDMMKLLVKKIVCHYCITHNKVTKKKTTVFCNTIC
jgi:hypothetical protein